MHIIKPIGLEHMSKIKMGMILKLDMQRQSAADIRTAMVQQDTNNALQLCNGIRKGKIRQTSLLPIRSAWTRKHF